LVNGGLIQPASSPTIQTTIATPTPVRLMTPGVLGAMHINWLGTLSLVESESENYNHVPRYRVPQAAD